MANFVSFYPNEDNKIKVDDISVNGPCKIGIFPLIFTLDDTKAW